MNKLLLIIGCLCCFNIVIATSHTETPSASSPTPTAIKKLSKQVQADSIPSEVTPVDENGCYSGGYGAPSCNISPGIVFANGISGGCSVTCKEGYFACCAVDCTCKKQI